MGGGKERLGVKDGNGESGGECSGERDLKEEGMRGSVKKRILNLRIEKRGESRVGLVGKVETLQCRQQKAYWLISRLPAQVF